MPPESRPSGKRKVIAIISILVLALGAYLLISSRQEPPAPPAPEPVVAGPVRTVIGQSVKGRQIEAYTYGKGDKHLVFVGGIHGGYEWNSTLLAYTFLDHLDANPTLIPDGLKITVIPNANPDGLFAVVGKEGRFTVADVSTSTTVQAAGRFNANKVDLNRNFNCKWQPKSTWRSAEVSAGTSAFSEPEARAIRDFASSTSPDAFVFWHSQSNAVYASQCNNGILPGTLSLMNTYATAAGYPAVKTFDAYVTTGAADDWLASVNIPAITVELKTHETIEWEKNLAGIHALIKAYAPVAAAQPVRTTMTGTYVKCLPLHDNFSTKTCTTGMKTDDGSYYALDFALMSQTSPGFKDGDTITAAGVITPLETGGEAPIAKARFSVTNIPQ
jgi:predicted deacylase